MQTKNALGVVAWWLGCLASMVGCGAGGSVEPSAQAKAQQAALDFHDAMRSLRLAAENSQRAWLTVYALTPDDLPDEIRNDVFASWKWLGQRSADIWDADRQAFVAAVALAKAAQHPAVQGALLGETVEISGGKALICGGLCVGGLIAGVTTYLTLMKGSKKITAAQGEPCTSRFGTDNVDDAAIIADVLGCAPTAAAMQDAWDELGAYEQAERCATIVDRLRSANDVGKGEGVDEAELQSASVKALAVGGEVVVEGVVGGGMSVTGGPVGKFVELGGGGEVLANIVEVALSAKEVNYTDLVGKAVEIQGISKKRVEMKLDPPESALTIAKAASILTGAKPAPAKAEAAAVVMTHQLLTIVDDPALAATSEPDGGVKLQRPALFTTASATMPAELLAKVTMPSDAMEQLIVASEVTAPAALDPPAPSGGKALVGWAPASLGSLGVPSGGADVSEDDTSGGVDTSSGGGTCSNAAVYNTGKFRYDDNGNRVPYPAGTCFLDSDWAYRWCGSDGHSVCACRPDPSTPENIGRYLPEDECTKACDQFHVGTAVACDDSQQRKDEIAAAKAGNNYYNLQGYCVCSDEFVYAKDEVCPWADPAMIGPQQAAWNFCVDGGELALVSDGYLEQGQAVCYLKAVGTSMDSFVQGCHAPPASPSIATCLDNDPNTFDVCKGMYVCSPGSASPADQSTADVCEAVPVQVPGGLGCDAPDVGKWRCVKVGSHVLPGAGTFDLTAKVRCKSAGKAPDQTYSVSIDTAEPCELTPEWMK